MTTPNPPLENSDEAAPIPSHRPPPTPQSWRGVTQGLEDAASLLQGHDYAQGQALLLQLLEFAPMEGKVWHLLGRCHQACGEHTRALECFAKAADCYEKQDRRDAQPASARLARLLWGQGDKHAARRMLEQLLEEQPGNAELLALQLDWEHTSAPGTGRNA